MTMNSQQPSSGWAETRSASPLKIIELSPDKLKPLGRKVRIHPKKQIDQLIESFRVFGFAVPIIVDENDRVIAGNARVQAASQAGIAKIPAVRLASLDAQQKRAFALAENKLNSLAKWDKAELKLEFGQLLSFDLGFSLDVTGFSVEKLSTNSDLELKSCSVSKEDGSSAVSRAGDVWKLGTHRLVCGGKALSHASFRSASKAKLTFAPSQVFHVGRKDASSAFSLEKDDLLQSVLELADTDHTLFVSSALVDLHRDLDAAKGFRFELVDTIVVVSEHAGGAAIGRSTNELVIGLRPRQRSSRSGAALRDRRVIAPAWWNTPPGSASPVITSNPSAAARGGVPLMLRKDLICAMTDGGDTIIDYLASDMSTLMIAEETGRSGLAVQTNLRAADSLIQEWEVATGSQATHVRTGRTFVETRADRSGSLQATSKVLPPARARSRRASQEMTHV